MSTRDAHVIHRWSSYLGESKIHLPLSPHKNASRTGTIYGFPPAFPSGIPTPFTTPPLIAQKSRALRRMMHRSQRLPTAESYSIRAPHPGSVHTLAPPRIPPGGGAFEGTMTRGPGGQSTSIRYPNPWHARMPIQGGFQPFPLAPFLVFAPAEADKMRSQRRWLAREILKMA